MFLTWLTRLTWFLGNWAYKVNFGKNWTFQNISGAYWGDGSIWADARATSLSNSWSGFHKNYRRSLTVISSKSAKDLCSKWPCWKEQDPCRAEETTEYTPTGARWMYAQKQAACYQGYQVVDGEEIKELICHWSNRCIIGPCPIDLDIKASEVPQFWMSMQSWAYCCRGMRNKIVDDWSLKHRYNRDKFLNGHWS